MRIKQTWLYACPLALLFSTSAAIAQQPPLPIAPVAGKIEPNTTGPITEPIVASIGADTYFINEFGADSIFLLIGKTRALVIDSGSGFFDLKGMVEKMTKLPYDVVITHGHPDHAGGIGQFDTVYMNLADVPMAQKITYEGRVQYGRIMRNMTSEAIGQSIGFANAWGYTDASVRKWEKFPTVKPIIDKQIFDLGGRKVTAYHVPNHTPGSMVFIDDKSRILFSGDAANHNVGAGGAVSTGLRGLLRMQKLRTDYDRQFSSHTAYADMLHPVPLDFQVLDDVIADYRSILRGNPQLKTLRNHLFPERTSTVAIYGRASVSFHPDKLWEDGEAHVIP